MCKGGNNTNIQSIRYFFLMLNELVCLLLFHFNKGFKLELNYERESKFHFTGLQHTLYLNLSVERQEKIKTLTLSMFLHLIN